MNSSRIGNHTIKIESPAYLSYSGVVAGPKEGLGPLTGDYDGVKEDLEMGEKSFEKSERRLMEDACSIALSKGNLGKGDIDYFIAGDLLNQITVSGFCALEHPVPFLGIYGACANLTQGLGLGAMFIAGGYGSRVLVATSSHNCSAERQYRYPTEYGFQKPGWAQWTVTGAGAAVITSEVKAPRITTVTWGEAVDSGIKDASSLGSAMAPAAAAAMLFHFQELQIDPQYYDLIVTGDLGQYGMQLARELMERRNYQLQGNYTDCGTLIYYPHQQVGAGGSGCASSALVTLGNIYRRLNEGELNKVLVVATGALHSPTSCFQGDSIPAVAHAVSIENE